MEEEIKPEPEDKSMEIGGLQEEGKEEWVDASYDMVCESVAQLFNSPAELFSSALCAYQSMFLL